MTEPRPTSAEQQQAEERQFWIDTRQALLMYVDAIERRLRMPRTSDLRRELKEARRVNELPY